MDAQVRSRIITISRADMWPGITPANVMDLDLGIWEALAVSCDEHVARIEERNAEIAARTRS